MRVLVTGGAGYIGSTITEVLIESGHDVVVYDNLRKGHAAAVPEAAGFIVADLADGQALRSALGDHETEAVVHMAADSLGGVGRETGEVLLEQCRGRPVAAGGDALLPGQTDRLFFNRRGLR